MVTDYVSFLAANVLNEKRIVTYRQLSRALKVHCNVAKKLLYEFHHVQNDKKPGSVHATYLLSGLEAVKSPPASQDEETLGNGGDVHMQSSPFLSSSMPQVEDEELSSSKLILLARQEDLDMARARYRKINSIHVYSLEASLIQNIQILSDCTRDVLVRYQAEDPIVVNGQYGVIQNSAVRRRTKPRHVPVDLAGARSNITANPIAKGILNEESSAKSKGGENEHFRGDSGATDSRKAPTKPIPKKPIGKPSTMKREGSDFFKSSGISTGKLSRENTGGSIDSTVVSTSKNPIVAKEQSPEDKVMRDALDDEDDDEGNDNDKEDFIRPTNKSHKPNKKSKSQREEEIRKMMEEEEEEDEEEEGKEEAEEEMTDATRPPTNNDPKGQDEEQKQQEEKPHVPRRHRSRRKILRKKTLKDEEGYLITKEEAVWESFSEDEPEPVRPAAPITSSSSVTGGGDKMKKGHGQGNKNQSKNIMSFFGKK